MITTPPLGISAAIEACDWPGLSTCDHLCDPGTMRVAPLASQKSLRAHSVVTIVAGCGRGSVIMPSSACSSCGVSSGPMFMLVMPLNSRPGSSTASTTGRTRGWMAACPNNALLVSTLKMRLVCKPSKSLVPSAIAWSCSMRLMSSMSASQKSGSIASGMITYPCSSISAASATGSSGDFSVAAICTPQP